MDHILSQHSIIFVLILFLLLINIGLVKFALDHGVPIDSVLNGVLPIHVACINDHVSVVQYLIERGADVNAQR